MRRISEKERIRRSENAKKMWKEGRLKGNGESLLKYYKEHPERRVEISEQERQRRSELAKKMWVEGRLTSKYHVLQTYWQRKPSEKKSEHLIKWQEENEGQVKGIIENARSVMLQLPWCKKGEEHHGSKYWNLRSPNNVVYTFKNLKHFIREHKNLFDPIDLIERQRDDCRAYVGLSRLRPDRKVPCGSWHGWTWVSIHERRFADGDDLIQRSSINY